MAKIKIDRNGNIKKKNRHLAIVLREGKGAKLLWIRNKAETFRLYHNTYFIDDSGAYITEKNVRLSVYMEGVSTPVHHGFIKRKMDTKSYVDEETNKEVKIKVPVIEGLKFDSSLIDILLNRHLADEFTKQHLDLPNLIIMILLICTLVIGVVNIGMWFL